MARRRTAPAENNSDPELDPEKLLEWREPPAPTRLGVSWASLLSPLINRKGQWAMIYTADSPVQAYQTQSNLHSRKVAIPDPQGNWEFVSRGCEVFAIYRGGAETRGSTRGTGK